MSLLTSGSGRGVRHDVYGPGYRSQWPPLKTGTTNTMEASVLRLRRKWMRAMGVPESEISEHCNLERYPADLAEELEDLRAMEEMYSNSPAGAELSQLAKQYPPPAEW